MMRPDFKSIYLLVLFFCACSPYSGSDSKVCLDCEERQGGSVTPVEGGPMPSGTGVDDGSSQSLPCSERNVLCAKKIFLAATSESNILPVADSTALALSSRSNVDFANVLKSYRPGELDSYYESNRLLYKKADEVLVILGRAIDSPEPEDANKVCRNAISSLDAIRLIEGSFSKILSQLRGVYSLFEKGNLLAEELFRCKEKAVTK